MERANATASAHAKTEQTITLRGVTWDHPRGYLGVEWATHEFGRCSGIRVRWERHSLHHFESHPINELAARYDLIVLDHPCMGDAFSSGCLIDLSAHADRLALSRLEADAVGRALDLYRLGGKTLAVPIDAACQVAVLRPDLMDAGGEPPKTLADARLRVGAKRFAIAARGVHSLMTLFTICANLGSPAFAGGGGAGEVVDTATGTDAIETLREILALAPVEALDWSSIDALNAMAERDDLAYSPFVFGFAAYGSAQFAHRQQRSPLAFVPIPGVAAPHCAGAVIGGTGLGISVRCAHRREAVAVAAHLTAARTQTAMCERLAQPYRRSVWNRADLNARYGDFYRNTLQTIDRGWVRPRYPGYVVDQLHAGAALERCLRERASPRATLEAVRAVFRKRTRHPGGPL